MSTAAQAASGPAARALGAATFSLTLGLTLAAVLAARPRPAPLPRHLSPPRRQADPDARAAGRLYLSSAMLAGSVLSDSALEHYRGDFENPGMFAPLVSAADAARTLALVQAAQRAASEGRTMAPAAL